MKLFLDTTDREAVKKWAQLEIVDGITTNPTILSQVDNPRETIMSLVQLLPTGDISVEVTERSAQAVYKQAHAIAQLARTIVVKVPCVPEYLPVIHQLVKDKIALNITLVFSAAQAIMMAKLGVKYISPFIGRLDDSGAHGMKLIRDICQIYKQYEFDTQILAASVRSPRALQEACIAGVDAVTISPELCEKLVEHPLSQKGAQKFLADWQQAGNISFP